MKRLDLVSFATPSLFSNSSCKSTARLVSSCAIAVALLLFPIQSPRCVAKMKLCVFVGMVRSEFFKYIHSVEAWQEEEGLQVIVFGEILLALRHGLHVCVNHLLHQVLHRKHIWSVRGSFEET